ncbi:glycosyltransferase [Belliella marina]|uniref:Glycosyltransferase n=1 Tax=Belliella marina TaxID=1644146 RepID=A0ABW4VPB1_9BACT
MKILLMSIGTRGDIEPFLAIGEIFSRKNHHVIYAFPEQYCHLIPNQDRHYAFTPKFLELVEGEDGRIAMGSSVGIIKKFKSIFKLYKAGMDVNKIMVRQQFEFVKNEDPDLIVHNGKCNYPVLWGLSTRKKTVLISPIPYFIHYVEGNGHTGFNGNYNELINRLTYKIANFGLIKTISDAQKVLPKNSNKSSKNQIKEKIFSGKLIYTISPSLFVRPKNWGQNIQVLGYHERNKKIGWQPSDDIVYFTNEHSRILFLTFGSMINSNPAKTTRTILNVLTQLKTPTIINIAAGGLVELEEFKENSLLFFTKQIPYDWILGKCYGIIHHGGSGTTHSGIKNGCVSMILPHIFDQYGWNNLIAKTGLGPKGIAVNKITENNLKPQIIDLFENESYKLKSKKVAEDMQKENFEELLYESIIN